MTQQQWEQLDRALQDLELPFRHPVVTALIRQALAGEGEPADIISRRIYEIAGAVLPGKEDPLLFEQLVFDLYKEIQDSFDREEDETFAPLRDRILNLIDQWMRLRDFLNEEEQLALPGNRKVQAEMGELLTFLQSLLVRLNLPEEETPDSAAELSFLLDQSEEVFRRCMNQVEEMLHPRPERADRREPGPVLILRVDLQEVGHPVWRKFRVSAGISLEHFHRILQQVMGWWDLYDHSFEQAGSFWGASAGEDDGIIYQDEEQCLLKTLLNEEDDLLRYRYDLPDGWHHVVRVDEVLENSSDTEPFCLDGAGACPPEDCGGPEGFRRLLASLKPDAAQDLKEDFSWVGDFDPDLFDRDGVNGNLKELL